MKKTVNKKKFCAKFFSLLIVTMVTISMITSSVSVTPQEVSSTEMLSELVVPSVRESYSLDDETGGYINDELTKDEEIPELSEVNSENFLQESTVVLGGAASGKTLAVKKTFVPSGDSSDIASGTQDSCVWTIDKDGVLTISPQEGEESGTIGSNAASSASYFGWYSYRTRITAVRFTGDVSVFWYCPEIFRECTNLKTVDLTNLDTSNTFNMGAMFLGCTNMESITFGDKFDTSKVMYMNYMFYGCTSLKSLDFGDKFDTSNVTTFLSWLYGCNALESVNLGDKFNTSNVTDFTWMFRDCVSLKSLDLGDNFDTSKATSLRSTFYNCPSLKSLELGDKLDTSNATDVRWMFWGCTSLESLDLGDKFDTSNATSFWSMFCYCSSLKSLDLGDKFDTSNITEMQYMFYGCESLESLDLGEHFNTSKVTNMYASFADCVALKSLNLGDNFDTSSAVNLGYTFADCTSLESLNLGSKFNTPNATSINGIFENCASLTYLDLSPIVIKDTSVETENALYYNPELTTLVLGENWRFNSSSTLTANTYWEYEETGEVYSAADLQSKYDGSTMSGTYKQIMTLSTELRNAEYHSNGTLNINNLWEANSPTERITGYCIDYNLHGVGTDLTRTLATDENVEEFLCAMSLGSVHGYEPLGDSMREALITLIYYGFPNDGAGIQKKYNLTDNEYRSVTQNAVWDFTDRYDSKAGPNVFSGNMLNAYNELVTQNFENITEDYVLYLYKSLDPTRQSLLSIKSISKRDLAFGGVQFYKGDNATPPRAVKGAEFTIYDSDGNEVTTVTSNAYGVAGIFVMDEDKGLPLGDYTVRETKAPNGYELTDDYYTFTIEQDQQIVQVGKLNGEGEDTVMVFYDGIDEEYTGGGVKVRKISESGEPLPFAEFTIYEYDPDEEITGDSVAVIYTDETGVASTGQNELPIIGGSSSYLIKETSAPAGYKLSEEEKVVTLTEDKTYYEEMITFTDEIKTGSVTLQAEKILILNGNETALEGGEFTFELKDADGNVLQTVTNDAEGKIIFDSLTYTANDLGFHNYIISEVSGNDENIAYDTHGGAVTVTVSDDGSDELDCTAEFAEEDLIFTNTETNKQNISISKKITGTSTELPNAGLLLKTTSGVIVSNIVTGNVPTEIELEPGTYILSETSVPSGYIQAANIRFTLNSDGTVTSPTSGAVDGSTVTMYDNKEGRYTVTLVKTDSVSGNTLRGAVFSLYGTDTDGSEFSLTATTNGKGIAIFESVPAGTYTLHEVSAPDGYEKAEDTTVTLNEDGTFDESGTTAVINNYGYLSVQDTKITAEADAFTSITVIKVDENGNEIGGAEFTLYSDADCTNAINTYTGGTFEISSGDSEILQYLPIVGESTTLYLKETSAPKGYVMTDTVYEINITANAEEKLTDGVFVTTTTYTITVNGESQRDVPNPKKTASDRADSNITVTKVDENGKRINGAVFTLYSDEDCSLYIANYIGGTFTIGTSDTELSGYLPNSGETKTLYLKETEVPKGYSAEENVYTIKITAEENENLVDDVFITTISYSITIDGKTNLDIVNTKLVDSDTDEIDSDVINTDSETDTDSEDSDTDSEETDSEVTDTDSEDTDSEVIDTDSEKTDSEVTETDSEETDSEVTETDSEETDSEVTDTDSEETDSEVTDTDSEEKDSEVTDTDSEETDSEVTDTDSEETDSEVTDTDSEETDSEVTDTDSEETDSEVTDTDSEETDSEVTDTDSEETDSEVTDTDSEETDSEDSDTDSEDTETDSKNTDTTNGASDSKNTDSDRKTTDMDASEEKTTDTNTSSSNSSSQTSTSSSSTGGTTTARTATTTTTGNNTSTNTSEADSMRTGDSRPIMILAVFMSMSIVGMVVFFTKRKSVEE